MTADEELRIIVEQAQLVITPESYRVNRTHHEIGDRAMARYGYDSGQVAEVRITESAIEFDVLDHAEPGEGFVFRTDHHDLRST